MAGFVVMAAVAAAGLACAGAADLPGGAFPRVVAAVVVLAAGGSVEVTGAAGFLADAHASLSVLPLSVSLAGALVVGSLFLRPLHNRAVTRPGELAARTVPLVLLWLLALTGTAFLARQTFGISGGDSSSPTSANSSTPPRRSASGPPCPRPSSSDCCGSWACCSSPC